MIRFSNMRHARSLFLKWFAKEFLFFLAGRAFVSNPKELWVVWVGWKLLFLLYTLIKSTFENELNLEVKKTSLSRAKESKAGMNDEIKSCHSHTKFNTQDGLPSDAFVHICSFLHPKDITTLACTSKSISSQANDNLLWKFLWYRDYGNTMLQWQVSRDSFARSLSNGHVHMAGSYEEEYGVSLEFSLSQQLEEFTKSSTKNSTKLNSIKQFYFVFGEVFINYVLAGRNSSHECLLGLHGHIFDFTHFVNYHPGLSILHECGQDATFFFESIPHSRGAREIARELCVLVNRACFVSSSSRSCRGLYCPIPAEDLATVLSNSNTTPISTQLRQKRRQRKQLAKVERISREGSIESNGNFQLYENPEWMLDRVLPRRVTPIPKRPPTLKWIRKKWDNDQQLINATMNSSDAKRAFYDPLQQGWMKWNPSATAKLNANQRAKFTLIQ